MKGCLLAVFAMGLAASISALGCAAESGDSADTEDEAGGGASGTGGSNGRAGGAQAGAGSQAGETAGQAGTLGDAGHSGRGGNGGRAGSAGSAAGGDSGGSAGESASGGAAGADGDPAGNGQGGGGETAGQSGEAGRNSQGGRGGEAGGGDPGRAGRGGTGGTAGRGQAGSPDIGGRSGSAGSGQSGGGAGGRGGAGTGGSAGAGGKGGTGTGGSAGAGGKGGTGGTGTGGSAGAGGKGGTGTGGSPSGGAGGSAGTGGSGDPTLGACTKMIGPGDNINKSVGAAGSVLCLQTGVYNQAVAIDKSGTAASPIVLRAAPGASPVIDGQNKLPGGQWGGLVELNGNYIVVSGLELRNSTGRGVVLLGTNNRLAHCNVHHAYDAGVLGTGDRSVMEYNEVWETARVNVNGASGKSGWPCAIEAARDEAGDGITNGAIIRGNVSHDNWGEGIDSYESEGTLIEDNVVYNNWSVNLYISDSRNIVVRNNLVYNAKATGGRGGDLTIADEVSGVPRSSNVEVTNNFLFSADICVGCWTLVKGMSNLNAHHNTLVNGKVELGTGNGTGFVQSANCVLSASAVPGLANVEPGALTLQMLAGAKCPTGTGATAR